MSGLYGSGDAVMAVWQVYIESCHLDSQVYFAFNHLLNRMVLSSYLRFCAKPDLTTTSDYKKENLIPSEKLTEINFNCQTPQGNW